MKRKSISHAMRQKIYERFNGHCAYCGCEIEYKEMQIDHVLPLYRGGTYTYSNLFPACRSCNHYKSTYTVDEFREQIEEWVNRLMRDSVTFKNAVRFGQVIPTPHETVFYYEKEVNSNDRESIS